MGREGERIWNDLGRERKNNRIHLNLNLKTVLHTCVDQQSPSSASRGLGSMQAGLLNYTPHLGPWKVC